MPEKETPPPAKPRRVVTRKRAAIGADAAAPLVDPPVVKSPASRTKGDTLTVQVGVDDPISLDQSVAPPVDQTDLGRMIAEAAYYRAERRGFAPGYEIEDWIAAEAEVGVRIREIERAERLKPSGG